MKLSELQLEEYRSQGYLKYGDLLKKEELIKLRKAYDEVLNKQHEIKLVRDREEENGDRSQVLQIRVAHLHHPEFYKLLHNTRLLNAVESIIGSEIKLVLFQGLYKPALIGGEIGWHQDDFYFKVNKPNAVVSCWITLDDVNQNNGCMWMQPKSHHCMLDHIKLEEGGFQINSLDNNTAEPMEIKAGQCLFHHGLAPHRTLKNSTSKPRRALALHFMDATATPLGDGRLDEPAENMPLLRSNIQPVEIQQFKPVS